MTIKERLTADMKQAMKAGDKATRDTVRMILAQIQSKTQEKKDLAIKKGQEVQDLTEEEVTSALQTFKKQTDEEIEAFAQRGDTDKVRELDESRVVIAKYLPQQMNRGEVLVAVHKLSEEIAPPVTKGVLMKQVMTQLKGKAENKLIGEVVDEVLKYR